MMIWNLAHASHRIVLGSGIDAHVDACPITTGIVRLRNITEAENDAVA
jgi:hypothetical protein